MKRKQNNLNQAGQKKAGDKMYNDLIELISCFPEESRYYWIKNLKCCNSIKGFLIIHFNLL